MKTWFVAAAAVAVVLLASPSFAQDDLAAVPRISVSAAKKALDAKAAVIVDVRDPVSYEFGHSPGALLVPLDQLPAKVAALRAAGKPLITYCG